MNTILNGVIHGKTILLDKDPGLLDGEQVQITVSTSNARSSDWGEGLRQSAGSLAHNTSLDAIMEQIQRDRKLTVYREVTG